MVRVMELLGSITGWRGRGRKKRFKQPKGPSQAVIRVPSFERADLSLYHNDASCDRLISSLCTFDQLDSLPFRNWSQAIREPWRPHRKLWELSFICQALEERGCLAPGKAGLGFAVGMEKLPAFFASRGCRILASDLPSDDQRNKAWAASGQWASGLVSLNEAGLCDPAEFRRLVSFRPIDMNEIPADLSGFDFNWSTCSFEHCGTIELGLRFLEEQMRCLLPGGIAVHTTEFNLSSNEETVSEGSYVLFRLKDIEQIVRELRSQGHDVEPIDLTTGAKELDSYIDSPPYTQDRHLRLDLSGFASTSIALIIRKAA